MIFDKACDSISTKKLAVVKCLIQDNYFAQHKIAKIAEKKISFLVLQCALKIWCFISIIKVDKRVKNVTVDN